MRINRTGQKLAFLDVHIGNPFWAHKRLWVRTNGDFATELTNTGQFGSSCNFLIDGTVRPKRKYGFPDDDRCEEIEAVEVESDNSILNDLQCAIMNFLDGDGDEDKLRAASQQAYARTRGKAK